MSIVAITSQHHQESSAIAEHTASLLGYRLVLMQDLVKATAEAFNTPEADLFGAFKERSLFHRFLRKQKLKEIALLEHKLCELMEGNEMVFCGFLGYPIFHEVSHVLKVLVVAHHEPGSPRQPMKSTASGNGNINWFKQVYHTHMEDPNLYDLTLNLVHMDPGQSAEIIVGTLKQDRFRPMTYSMNCQNNLGLACQVKTALVDQVPDVAVKSHDGTVYVYSRAFKKSQRKKALAVKEAIMRMQGVNYVEVCQEKAHFDDL
jgi:hypothetical protein